MKLFKRNKITIDTKKETEYHSIFQKSKAHLIEQGIQDIIDQADFTMKNHVLKVVDRYIKSEYILKQGHVDKYFSEDLHDELYNFATGHLNCYY